MEVKRLYVEYFSNEVLVSRMEPSEIEAYTQDIDEVVEANDGERKRQEAELAKAEEVKREAASYKEAVTAMAGTNMGGYKNSSFPRLPNPLRFHGCPQPHTSASINAANARLAASRATDGGE